MKSKSLKQKLVNFFKGKQGGAVPTAIKVLTAVVCGAVIMMGLYGVVTGVVLPASSDKVNSMFSYEAEGGAGGSGGDGGYGGGTGDPTPTYEMLEGDGSVVNTNAFTPLTFRSSAPYDTFQAVKVDGEVVDSSNYTVSEGSTIVTFNAEYTKALAVGEHTVEIVSGDGSATANFTIEAPAELTTLTTKTWVDAPNIYDSQYIWTDGTSIYYSKGSSLHYVLHGNTWRQITWNGFKNLYGAYVWTDGVNTYYSKSSEQYVLNGDAWEVKTWNGLTSFDAIYIWSDGINYYYSRTTSHYVFS